MILQNFASIRQGPFCIKKITHPTKSLCYKGMTIYNMNFSPSFSSSSVDIPYELKIKALFFRNIG